MKHLSKVIVAGLSLWLLGLLWLDLNRILLWPLFISLISGMIPAYLLGWYLSRAYDPRRARPVNPPAHATRPTPTGQLPTQTGDPTRPTRRLTHRERASTPTRSMPVL